MLRAAVAMFTRRDMVGAVRAWQSACRAAATLTHALRVLMDRDLLCAGGLSGSRCERLRCGVCATYVGGGDEADDACLSRWYEAAEMQVAQTVAIDHLRTTCFV